LFDTGFFAYNQASKFVVLDKEGTLTYQEASVDEEAMNGTITIIDRPFSSNLTSAFPDQNTSSNNKIETVGAYVSTIELEKYISEFTSKGFVLDSMHTFKVLLDGQGGAGASEQTLIIWTSFPDVPLDKVVSALKELTPHLPYS
jgi:hypothetical protein